MTSKGPEHTPAAVRPAGVFAPIQREFDRLFDQLGAGWSNLAEAGFNARMDLRDAGDALEITMEAPGVDEKDISISVEDGVLTIRGEKKREHDDGHGHHSERVYGAFSRSLALPRTVQSDKITASMDKGVLKLVVPKAAAAEARTIPIVSAQGHSFEI